LIKTQILDLTKENDVEIDLNAPLPKPHRKMPAKPDVKMLYNNDQPLLQFFEETDP